MPPHIVIAGAGIAGMTAVLRLAPLAQKDLCRITLISETDSFLFPPGYPWVATGRMAPDVISRPLKQTRQSRIARIVPKALRAIDPERRQVFTADGTLNYDMLIVATGTVPDRSAVPGYEHAHSIATMSGCLGLRERLRNGVRKAVVAVHQASPCALGMYELAFVLARAGVAVQLVTTDLRPGEAAATRLGAFITQQAHKTGIEVIAGRNVAEVGKRNVWLDDDSRLEADVAVVAAPPRAPDAVAALSPATTRSGLLLTRSTLASVAWNTVYGAGGVAVMTPPTNGRTAEQMGMIAADNAATALQLRPGALREFLPDLILLLDLGGQGVFIRRLPSRGLGPAKQATVMVGRALATAKVMFHRAYLRMRV